MRAPRSKPTPIRDSAIRDSAIRDSAPPQPADPPPHRQPRRRRALRPAIVATATVVAVGVGSTVGTLAFDDGTTDVAAIGTAAVAPDGPTDTATTRGTRVGIATADQPAGPGSATQPAGRVTPTGTGAVGGLGPPTPAAAQAGSAAPATGDSATEAAVLTLVNQERAKANCGALSTDARLTAASRAHSADMAGRGYFAHDTPDGVDLGTRVTRAGYRFSAVGENIAKGQRDAAAVMSAWMNSPGHRANILNCRFSNIGIGLGRQGRTPLWTQDFGTPLR